MSTKPQLRFLAFKRKEQRQAGWGRTGRGDRPSSLALRLHPEREGKPLGHGLVGRPRGTDE